MRIHFYFLIISSFLVLSNLQVTAQCNVTSNGGTGAAPLCGSDRTYSLGAGQSMSVTFAAGVYQFGFTDNSQSSGICVNGTRYTGNPTILTLGAGTFLVGPWRANSTWSASSAVIRYQSVVPTLTATTASPTTICTGGSVNIVGGTASNGTRYWQNTTSNGTSTGTSGSPNSVSPTTTTTYYYRPYNTATPGCWGTQQSVTITVVADPTAPTAATPSPASGVAVCVGQALSVSSPTGGNAGVSGCGFEYQFLRGTTVVQSWSATTSYTTVAADIGNTIYVEIRRAGCTGTGCTATSASSGNLYSWPVVDDPTPPTGATKNPNVATVCVGQALSVSSPTGGNAGVSGCSFQYQFLRGVTVIQSWSSTASYTTVAADIGNTINVEIRRSGCTGSGCTATSASSGNLHSWSVVADPSVSITSQGAAICVSSTAGTTLNAVGSNGTGSFTYQWQRSTTSSGSGYSNVGSNSSSYATGTVTQTTWIRCTYAASGDGCNTATSGVTQLEPIPLAPSVSSPYTGCGAASVSATTGTYGNTCRFYGPNSTVTLAGTGTSINVTTLGTSTYYITSYNSSTGCESAQVPVSVTVTPTFNVTMTRSNYNGAGVSCDGSTNGTATATVTSTNFPITYSWSTGANNSVNSSSNTISTLSAGSYQVNITDNGGCVGTGSITLPEPTEITSTLSATSYGLGFGENCNGASVGAITTSASGGTGSLSYAWTSTPSGYTSSTQNPSGLSARTYNLVITDANGCTSPNSIQITEPAVITFTTSVGFACSGGSYTSGSITFTASGGATGNYQYSINNGASWSGSNTFTGLSQGNYTVRVRDASTTSCLSSTAVVNITFPAPGTSVGDCNFVYVSTSGDPGNPGTAACPTNLTNALSIASTTSRNHIMMQQGTYNLSSTVVIPALSGGGVGNGGIVIDGGYSSSWVKSSSVGATTLNITPVLSNNGTVGYYMGIQPASGANGFSLKDLTINVQTAGASTTYNNRGVSIYGVYISGQTGFKISRCVINTGAASGGLAGAVNNTAGGGSAGGAGGVNPCVGSAAGCSATGCGGGSGSTGTAGGDGASGGSGGGGGSGCTSGGCNIFGCNASGCNASGGSTGGTGAAAGSLGQATASLSASLFSPTTGSTGYAGAGGGGGGSGGNGAAGTCCTCSCGSGWASGGNGGSGGAGGGGGAGGYGGGGSFGIYAWGGNGTLVDVQLNPGSAGTGGSGAAGRPGVSGSAGSPGNCRGGCDGGCGGNGGAGGAGRQGGQGQQGANGISQNLVSLNSASISWTGTTVPTDGIVTANYYRGCTKSQIDLTKTTGSAWTNISTDPAFVNDLTSSSTSYTTGSSAPSIYYPSSTTLGDKNISLGSTTLSNFIKIYGNRLVDPATSIINSITTPCPNGTISLSTNLTSGQLSNITEWDWDVTSVSSPSTILYNSSAAAPGVVPAPGGGWVIGTTYQVRLRIKELCCGWSIPIYRTFTVSPVLAAASPITPSPSGVVCAGQSGVTYSVPAVSGATNYTWTVNGGTIASGQGTTSITVNWGPALVGASVSVKATNACTPSTDGPTTTITFNINAAPTVTIIAQGGNPTTFCSGSSVTLQANSTSGGGVGTGVFSYSWPAPGSGSSQTYTASSSGNYTVVVTEAGSGCSVTSSAETVTVVAQPQDPTSATQSPASSPICVGTVVSVNSPSGGNSGVGCSFEYRFQDGGSGTWTGWSTTNSYTTTSAGIGANAAKIQVRRGNCQTGCSSSAGTYQLTWNVVPGVINPGFRTWTGMVSTAWENDLNWDCGGAPTISIGAIIPASVTTGNYPVVANGITGNCLTLRIDGPPSTVEIQNGGNLNVVIP